MKRIYGTREDLLGKAAALVLGTAGGYAFYKLNLPLPWMLGAMLATFFAVISKVPLVAPTELRPLVIPVIGVMLGSSFTADTFSHIIGWGFSLAGLAVYLAIAAVLVIPIYTRIGRLDPATAFFSAMPGGLNEMTILGGAMGGDEKRIILAHASRVLISILAIAIWFRLVLGYEVSGIAPGSANGQAITFGGAMLLLVCAVFGSWGGKRLRFPAPNLLGPLLLSAAVHITGLSHSSPPPVLVIAAQIILGAGMGCRFRGAEGRLIVQTIVLSTLATVVMLALSIAMALLFHGLFGQTTEQVILAYAPGGLTEMSLVALAMNADVAYISLHHLARIVMIVAIAPPIITRVLNRRRF